MLWTGMQVFVSRQPVFSANRALYGYELLFRDGVTNVFRAGGHDAASLQVLEDKALWADLEVITGGKRAFVNFTRDTLVQGFAQLLPARDLVVELAADIRADDEVVNACQALKEAGYTIALEGFVIDGNQLPLLGFADIVKADPFHMSDAERRAVPQMANDRHIAYLAEKVEDAEQFHLAFSAGYSLFQGHFFARPAMVKGAKVEGAHLNHLRILDEVNAPSIDFDHLEWLIRPDASLVYKILRLVNSAWFGLRSRIESIKHALVMLGESGARRWVNLIVLADVCKDKPTELARTSAVRAFFCEAVGAAAWPGHEHNLFLLGLFSLVDAILEVPMDEAIRDLPLPVEVADVLLGHETPYRPAYDLALAYERADWQGVDRSATALGLSEEQVLGSYHRAVERAAWSIS